MKVAIESLVSYEQWIHEPEKVLRVVDAYGEAIIIKENHPAYCITAYEAKQVKEESIEKKEYPLDQDSLSSKTDKANIKKAAMTLKDAAKEVLSKTESLEMHVSMLADLIYERGLYHRKDGSKAPYTQVRAMCGQYPDDFVTLKNNVIRLL